MTKSKKNSEYAEVVFEYLIGVYFLSLCVAERVAGETQREICLQIQFYSSQQAEETGTATVTQEILQNTQH